MCSFAVVLLSGKQPLEFRKRSLLFYFNVYLLWVGFDSRAGSFPAVSVGLSPTLRRPARGDIRLRRVFRNALFTLTYFAQDVHVAKRHGGAGTSETNGDHEDGVADAGGPAAEAERLARQVAVLGPANEWRQRQTERQQPNTCGRHTSTIITNIAIVKSLAVRSDEDFVQKCSENDDVA